MPALWSGRARAAGWRLAWAALASLSSGNALAQRTAAPAPPAATPSGRPADAPGEAGVVHAWHVQGRVYMLVGAGPNITVQVGDEALFVVDAGRAEYTDAVLAAIRQLSGRPVQYVIDTSGDPDHVGGNLAISKAGFANSGQRNEPTVAGIVAQLNVLQRMDDAKSPPGSTPTDTYDGQWALYNDEAVLLTHAPAAHSDGDSYVFFRSSDVISTGELFNPATYPVIERDRGGSLEGILSALTDMIGIMVPRQNEEGGTYLIPAHGAVCDRTAIVNYRDALTIIRARIRYEVAKGMTLEQVLASRPSFDYDGIYGSDSEPWTTRMFLEAVYREVASDAKTHGVPHEWREGHH
ncbi:MAG TPA: MBL fold metallo-hydrolase [Steroidobacteraceae bacterium]|nr:MBL fold metallo-hydrolase [Steroidobacteraceae bacterium]